jgi:hypothetical protein
MFNILTTLGLGVFLAGSAFLSTHLGFTGPIPGASADTAADTEAHVGIHSLMASVDSLFAGDASVQTDESAETSAGSDADVSAEADASADVSSDAHTDKGGLSFGALFDGSIR